MMFFKLAEYRFRILAGVLLVIFLVSTWFLFLQQPKYPEELHIHLQEQLKNLIKNRLYESDPALINDLTFDRVHTESTKREGQLKAYFQYTFIDKQRVKTVVQGTAMIYRRILESSDDHELWVLTDFHTNSTLLDFEEPVTLLPSSQGKGGLLEAVDSDLESGETGNDISDEDIEDSSSSWENSDTQPEEAASEKEKIQGTESLEADEIVRMEKTDESEEEEESTLSEDANSSSRDQEDSSEPAKTNSESNSQSETREDSVEEVNNSIEEEDSSDSVDSVTE